MSEEEELKATVLACHTQWHEAVTRMAPRRERWNLRLLHARAVDNLREYKRNHCEHPGAILTPDGFNDPRPFYRCDECGDEFYKEEE